MTASRHGVYVVILGSAGIALLFGQHPHPQPRPAMSQVLVSPDGSTTTVIPGISVFPACNPDTRCDPFLYPPGTNFLPTIYTNTFDGKGVIMENTLPSTPTIPYNLHDGEPKISLINNTSPQDDLHSFFNAILVNAEALEKGTAKNVAQAESAIERAIQGGIDILEGNPNPGLKDRAYIGFPLLHYKVEKVRKVDKATCNVNIHQVWYDTHIESDTAFLDVSDVEDVPWT